MAFMPVTHRQGYRRVNAARVRVCFPNRPYQSRQVIVTLTRPLLDQIKWKPDDRILVQIGTGEDFGAILMTLIKKGGNKLSQKGNLGTVTFTVPEMIGVMPYGEFTKSFMVSAICPHRIEEGQLHITLQPAAEISRLRVAE